MSSSTLPQTMKSIQIPDSASPTSPAIASSLFLSPSTPLPKPTPAAPYLIRVHASSITRDELLWPQTYTELPVTQPRIPGHDFSGTIVEAPAGGDFKVGEDVYGSVQFGRLWAEYAVCPGTHMARKPKGVSHEQAATIAKSAMTAWQGLFEHGGLAEPGQGGNDKKKVLITGAAGAVGTLAIQLASWAGVGGVVAAASAGSGNEEFVKSLTKGVEFIDVKSLENGEVLQNQFDLVLDTIGGQALKQGWKVVKDGGRLVSINSSCFYFAKEHREEAGVVPEGKNVEAIWMLVHTEREQLEKMEPGWDQGLLTAFVAETYPLSQTAKAYEAGNVRSTRRGKIVISML